MVGLATFHIQSESLSPSKHLMRHSGQVKWCHIGVLGGHGCGAITTQVLSLCVCVCRKHLEALLAKEQLDTAERDSMIDAALAEQNAKRDAELAARMAARKQLLLEVTQGQWDQIQQHQHARYRPVLQVHTHSIYK